MKIALLALLFVVGGCKEVVIEEPKPTVPPVVEQPPVTEVPVPVVTPPVIVSPPPVVPPTVEPVYEGKVVKMGVDAQTIDQALALVKTVGGTILFERGKVYALATSINYRNVTTKNLTFAAYGTGSKPVIKTGGKRLVSKEQSTTVGTLTIRDLVIDGEGNKGTSIFWIDGGSVVIENSEILFGQVSIQHYAGEHPKNVVIKNSRLMGAWNIAGQSHAQCLYTSKVDGLVVEGNSFEHCGWKENTPGGEATMFNHALYLSSSNDIVIKNNTIADSSSMGIKFRSDVAGESKNILVEGNHFTHGEIGVGIGGNTVGQDRFQNVKILNNTFEAIGATAPTKRNLAWGIGVDGDTDVVVQGNKFSKWPTFSNKWVVRVDTHVKNLTIDLPVTGTQKGSDGKVQYTLYGSTKE